MKKFTKGLCLSTAIVAAGAMLSTNAMAFEMFQIQEDSVAGAVTNLITADRITGGYEEVVTFGAGVFDVSILWTAGQYFDGGTSQTAQVGGLGANNYDMYGLFQASGTFSTVGTVTTFVFNPGGSLDLIIDPDQDSGYPAGAPLTGDLAWTATGNTADDYLIATGEVITGNGRLDPSQCDAGGGTGVNCGSFGTDTSFDLTAAGENFFVAPNPFYDLSFQSGQFVNFPVAGTQTIVGSLDAVFGRVPEPATLALFGLGLAGMAGVARRKTKQQA